MKRSKFNDAAISKALNKITEILLLAISKQHYFNDYIQQISGIVESGNLLLYYYIHYDFFSSSL